MASPVPPRLVDSVLDLVGETPLVAVRSGRQGTVTDGRAVSGKMEKANPGGSVKDRLALEEHFDGA
jgi:cysteine synthase